MILAVIGSGKSNTKISDYIPKNATTIITGGLPGIETSAEKYADKKQIPKLIIKADYNNYGDNCLQIRNKIIIEIADEILVIRSKNSAHIEFAIEYAKKLGKNVALPLYSAPLSAKSNFVDEQK